MDKKTIWGLAAKNGLILSLITIITDLIGSVFTLNDFVSIFISVAKIVAIIWVLYIFMKQYAQDRDYVSYSESFKYGFILCLCSSVVCTAFSMLNSFVIAKDKTTESLETIISAFDAQGVQLSMDYDQLMGILPSALIISVLIRCLFWGVVFPSILANYTKKGDVFSDKKEEE